MPTPEAPVPSDWAEIKSLFDAMADLSASARAPLLAAVKLSTPRLAELQSLLAHHDQSDQSDRTSGFLSASAATALAVSGAWVGQRLGPWQIVRGVGAGGMGEVFEARRADGSFEGRAAVKLLKRGMDSAAVLQRFAQERQALARLSHPHIARLLDAGASADGLPYFVMEFVDGQSIDLAVKDLPLNARLALFLQLASAVAYAHRNLVVHRDLKPGNVLVDGAGQVKLLDFGIAKALDPIDPIGSVGASDSQTGKIGDLTANGQRPFTPNYASPEQVRGEPVTTGTDIYSLGVLLYQMLTGTRPTGRNATTPAEAARSVLEDEPTKPSRLSVSDISNASQVSDALSAQWLQTRKRLAGDLDNILLKALEKSLEKRYASVDAMASDVRAYLSGQPVAARPASTGYLLAKFVARNRMAVASAGLGLLALVLGLAGTLWQWQQATLARAEEAKRFAQVRVQANNLLFNYHDAILLLPGSTPLVARLLTDARSYLASLSDSAQNDPALLRELAVAHRRLGDLYASPGRPALGDVKESLSQHQKAVELLLRAQVLQADSTDGRYQLALAQAALGEARLSVGDAPAALPLYQASRLQLDALANLAPGNVAFRVEQVRAQLRLSDLHANPSRASLNQPASADAYLAQAAALLEPLRRDFAQDLDVAALYASTQNTRFLAAARAGRWQDGLALLDALQPVFAQLVERAPDNALHARDAAVNSLSRGTALAQLGRHADARAASSDALARMQKIAVADPANRNAARDVAKLQLDVATASLKLSDAPEAMLHISPAVQALEALLAADPADRRVAGLLALAQATWAQAEAQTLAESKAEAKAQSEAKFKAQTLPAKPTSAAQLAALQSHANRALAVAKAMLLSAPADATGQRTVAMVQQQVATAWRSIDRKAEACQHNAAALAAWQTLQTNNQLRPSDQPRLDSALRDSRACPAN